ncbi:MAG: ABC transporter substrate-binding protein [Acidimicrobiales bacterium]|jgi:raffinose/stachyose/melibiose transport system substrate-binding protein
MIRRPRFRARPLASAALCLTMPLAASSQAGATPAHKATTTTINWWGWTPTDSAEATAEIAAFNRVYPDIKVNFKLITIANYPTAMRPALVSGEGPDLFELQPGAYVTEFGSFAKDMAPVAAQALGSNWRSKIAPSGIDGFTYNGKLTALSVGSVYAGTLWVNEDLFKKYHLSPPTTLAQWVSVCKAFKSHGVGCFVQGNDTEGFLQDTLQSITNSVQPGLWTAASKGDAKWTSPGIVKALTIWKGLFSDGIMEPGSLGISQYPQANNDFLTGKYAMIMMGTWYTANVTKSGMTSALQAAGVSHPKPFPILPVPFPNVGGHPSAMYGDADYGLAVYNKSKNTAAAETFAKWLATSVAGQQYVANQLEDLPSLKSVTPNYAAAGIVSPSLQLGPIKRLAQTVGTVTEPRESLLSSAMQNGTGGILAAAQGVATGSETPQAAAKALQAAAVASGVRFK